MPTEPMDVLGEKKKSPGMGEKKEGGEHKAKKKGMKHTHIEHHDSGHTVTHTPHEGEPTTHAVGDLDQLHDNMEDNLGQPNPGESADAGAGAGAAGGGQPDPNAGGGGMPPQGGGMPPQGA